MTPKISRAHKRPKKELYEYITDDYIKQQDEEERRQKETLIFQLYGRNCYLEGPLPVTDDDNELNHEKAFRLNNNDCDLNSGGGGDDDHGGRNNDEESSWTQPVPVSEVATTQPVTTRPVSPQPVTSQPVSIEPVVNLNQHRSKLQKLSATWKDLMKVFPKAYLAFLGRNGGLPNMLDGQDSLMGPSCGCPDDYIKLAKVNFFFVWGVKESEGFFYCSHCNTLPVALVESGFFPLSPNRPTGAVHFSLCDFFLRLRNTFAGSAEKISSFYDAWATGTEKATISEEKCSSTILLYHKMVELSEQMKNEDLIQSFDKSEKPGTKGTSITATKDVTTAKSPTTKKSTVEEPRICQVLVHQNRTSAIYPVRGVLGSGCARHDTVFQLADMNAGEGFKYPLVAISFVENQLGRKVPLHVMYDIVCKLEPSIKLNFPGSVGSDRLGLSVFHAYAHVMHCQVKYTLRYIEKFGLIDGEDMERLWSYLAKYITLTKPMMPENRRYVLYMAVKYKDTVVKFNMAKVLRENISA
ncbi:uncharacterized protein EV154DRAFT_561284 [Mucor mucedo]|uniref:uncharacterized protein n=1 Tax=Mucor mucedo TaxID=29922 RepID=UPI00221E3D18|nr:uncharacterized protein EV154DRAFT_561284 [Mucor mucedo]KAI7893534.1 hypothetical protein EV154DRAFT_561284 [Mucor mucedo]